MIKGLVFCVCFLIVQLLVLAHIDNRLNSSNKEARQVVTTTAVQRERKDDDDTRKS